MASLYELSASYRALLNMYDDAETEESRQHIIAMMISGEEAISDKAEAYARIMRNKQAEAEALKAEADRLTEKRRAAEAVVERLKAALLDAMKLADTDIIPTSIGKWRKQANPWSVEVIDVDSVPAQYHIAQPDKIDKKGLLDNFKATGEIVDGVEFRQTQGIRFR